MHKIYIPSYKRADNCVTAKSFSKAVICVHEFEADEYRTFNENEILVMPDSIGGKGMGVIRNWILDNTPDPEIVMMDDDITSIGMWENEENIFLAEEEVYDFIDHGFRMAKELGTTLFGLNLLEDKKAYREFTPLSFGAIVLAPFFGVIKSEGLRFDEELGLKEDYDYSLQVLRKFRKILRFNKFHYVAGHLDQKGGCGAYRNTILEQEQKVRFVEKWGNKVVSFSGKDTNPVIHSPIKGI